MRRIGILRGGRENYEMSLWGGGNLIAYLSEVLPHKCRPVDVLVARDGVWHIAGVPGTAGDLMHRVDMVWNVAHPSFSKTLADLSIAEIGMPENFSYLEPEIWKKEAENLGIKIPRRMILSTYQKDFDGDRNRYAVKKAKEVHEKFSPPWQVRSLIPSHMGVHVASTFNELVDAIEDGVSHEESIQVEELIPGKSVEAHTLSGYRGEKVYVFPGEVNDIAKKLHEHLHPRHYLHSNFIVHPKRGMFLSDLNFVPDLRAGSSLQKLCAQIGTKSHEIVEHMLDLG
ncbi:MAG: hypothetical protein AAB500_01900 [Patescibacteria group bacterium]